jgi:hypothetical protein
MFKQIHVSTVLIQECTICIDQMETFHVSRKVHIMMSWKFSTVYHVISQALRMKKAHIKVALRTYLNTHSFYSVDEFLMCKDNP